jgi:hypothetical protein
MLQKPSIFKRQSQFLNKKSADILKHFARKTPFFYFKTVIKELGAQNYAKIGSFASIFSFS